MKIFCSIVFLLMASPLFAFWGSDTGWLKVHFIDVGYGDCIFIEFPDGGTFLIDGGDKKHGGEVLNYIKERGVKKIDDILITHPHEDHLEGLYKVIPFVEVGRIISSEDIFNNSNYERLTELIDRKKVQCRIVKRGDVLIDRKDVLMIVLNPSVITGDYNASSVAAKLIYKKVDFLFTADIDDSVCKTLSDIYGDELKSDVLKVPHHGKSGSYDFIKSVMPRFAVISVGDSIWGGPYEKVLNNLKKLKVRTFRTDKEGTIVIKTNGRKIKL